MKLVRNIIYSCAVLIYSTASYSALLNVNNGILLGASDVDVNGVLYDVSFIDGTCAELFSGCDQNTDFPFANPLDLDDGTLGTAANAALLDQVFIDSLLGMFDSDPTKTNGCQSSFRDCQASTPLFISQGGAGLGILGAFNSRNENRDNPNAGGGVFSIDSSDQIAITYAVWSESQPSPVPVPAATWLFGSGLIGLVGMRRKLPKVSILSA